MTDQSNSFSKVWRSAQLFIGFHRDQNGIKQDVAKVWSPKNASATIHSDPTEQEAFVVVRAADEQDLKDVQIKLRQDQIVLRLADVRPGRSEAWRAGSPLDRSDRPIPAVRRVIHLQRCFTWSAPTEVVHQLG